MMRSKEVIDVDKLLSPIAEDNRTGVDLRRNSSHAFEELKKIRDKAIRAEKSEGEAAKDDDLQLVKEKLQSSGSNWSKVFDLAQYVIAQESKDFQVAAWLIEASARLHRFSGQYRDRSFAGLRDGFCLVKGLVENFWEDFYSSEQNTRVENELQPLKLLNVEGQGNTKLIPAIRKVPITDGSKPFAYWEYELLIKKGCKELPDHKSYEDLERSTKLTPKDFFWFLISDLQDCQTELAGFAKALREKTGSENEHTSNISQTLQEVLNAVRHVSLEIAGYKLPENNQHKPPKMQEAPSEAMVEAVEKNINKKNHGFVEPVGSIQSREEAFLRLDEIANFFEITEPHSPVSYTLREVVRRGRLSLVELLGELIPDEEPRIKFLERAGIFPQQKD